ncbi:MAG: hypothetical protein QOE70_2015 [Chthoniobacter sp.]|jgi:putative membrane-bound dehydrogenase-like protein|nr:hypothetical protein [Chthoniobacter sp.]
MKASSCILLAALAALVSTASAKTPDGKPLVLLLAGRPSHGPGEHEHNAGVQLLAKCLAQGAPNVVTKVHLNAEWPNTEELAQADTIVFYADGGGGHFLLQDTHLDDVAAQMKRGAGFVCLHYAVEYPADRGGPQALEWMGGFFEANWSVNPHWQADFKELPKHPVSNGVKPFSTNDEWYFHMRFAPEGKGKLTHVLSAVPPESTMSRKDGAHEGNPTVRAEVAAGKPQTTSWAFERPDGGRGFGFTGGHYHKGWGQDDQRKLVLNAILWTAKVEVPANGVESKVTEEDLSANLDPKGKPKQAAAPAASAAPAGDPASVKPVFSSPVVHEKPVAIKVELKGEKELYLVVTDGGDGFEADWADWAEPVLIKADGSKIKLTDLTPKSTKVGFGKFGLNHNAGGKPMKLGGQAVEFGFGAHAPSIATFDLPEGVVAFEARGGVDSGGTDQGKGATVIFQIFTKNPGEGPLTPAKVATASASERYGLAAAKANMATFKTPDGLVSTLFAAEPMIQNPTNIDIDPSGRIWAVECVNYRKYSGLRPDGDRVVILEDTKGTGEADKETTFFQDPQLTNPLGICVLPGPGGSKKGTQVLVSAAPNLWLLTDTDGDDKADKSEILLKVSGNFNHDHQIHAFSFGVDGKFYFNIGNEAHELKRPDGTLIVDVAGNRATTDGKPYRGGMVFRADLVDGQLQNIETLGWNFRNNYEVCVDSFGTMWQSDNDDDGNKGVRINYVMDYGNYGYSDEMTGGAWQTKRPNLETEIPLRHWHQNDPGVVPNLLQTGGGSPTGITVNEGTALGPQFANQLIHCDAGPRTTRAYPVENDGAGYKATMVDILTSTDNWYRPSDVAIGTDGSLYIADWYDPGVGGHGMGDNTPGKIMGRIYRVAATGAAPKGSAPDFSTTQGAVKALQSPNRSTVYVAWQKLHALGAAAEPELAKLLTNENPRLRARALGVLTHLKGSETKYLVLGLKDADANVRIAAIRLCRQLARTGGLDTEPLESDATLVSRLLKDTPQVRREIALSLHGAKEIARMWAALALQHDGKDRWYLEALGIGAVGNEDACFDAWLAAVGSNWNTPAGRDIIWRLRSAKAAGYLAKIIADQNLPAGEKPRFLRAFDFLPASPEKTKALAQLATVGGVADEISREVLIRLKGADLKEYPDVATAIKGALERAKGTAQFVELVRDFGAAGQGSALLDTALALGNDPAAGDALKLVLADPDGQKIIDAALAGSKADAVIALLGTSSDLRAMHALIKIATNPALPPAQRIAAIQALARTQAGAQSIVQLAKNTELPADLKAPAGAALRLVQYAALKNEIEQLFPAPATLGGKPLASIAELVKLTGDATKGRAVFERAESSCIICHRINDKGADVGPALSEIGTKLPKEAIFDAIINPNASISMGFETNQLTTRDGAGGMGILRSETKDEIVLALPGGVTMSFRKGDVIKREKLPTSMMPSGLNQALSQQDLVDLVEYLASLKAVK